MKGERIMTRTELINKIEEIEEKIFRLEMIDRWSAEDYFIVYQYRKEVAKLKKELSILKAV